MPDKKTFSGRSNVAEPQRGKSAPTEVPATDVQERYERIATAAYLRAAARGFIGGDPLQDWLEAEMEVNAADENKERV